MRVMTAADASALWIKDPLAILADGAERGVVVKDGRSSNWCRGGSADNAMRRSSTPAHMWCCRG